MNRTFYVATLARYVLVEASDEAEARELGLPALRELFDDDREIEIKTVRLATDDEIELWRCHTQQLDSKAEPEWN